MKPLTSYTCKLDEGQARALQVWLRDRGYEFREVPHAEFAAAQAGTNVVFYGKSKKLLVQGKGTQEFVEFVLEPVILGEARVGYETVLNPELLRPRIGIDESGKGDFFGPMCVAGVYVNEKVLKLWEEEGVRDSKRIGSDKRIEVLADVIKKTSGCVWTLVPIGNEAYNRLILKLRSVNQVLAWGHARAIENLLGQKHRMEVKPELAIVDQFAASQETVRRALMELGRDFELLQKHKAEEDLAVAAASILARAEFVRRLKGMSERYGVELPKGASDRVIEAGRVFVEKHGEEKLGEVAKLHFRTREKVLGRVGGPVEEVEE